MLYLTYNPTHSTRDPWNKGKLIGQRPPLKQREVWSIRVRVQIADKVRDLALFNIGRHLIRAQHYRNLRVGAFSEWSRAVA